MKLHEYQAKALLRSHGVAVPQHVPVFSAGEALAAAQKLATETKNNVLVVKSQIHAGGRGKGRFKEHPDLPGVKVVKSPEDAASVAEQMLGSTLVTKQTGPSGQVVRRVLIEQGLKIAQELYVGALVDRVTQRICVMACAEGGVEIEEVAARSPEKIIKQWIDPATGFSPFQARQLALSIGLSGQAMQSATKMLLGLARAFEQEDCTLAEINPLAVTDKQEVIAMDAKISVDDNAAFRHPQWETLRDTTEEDPAEVEAQNHDLSYVHLDGTIGCMVNGAGLAMATMDIIKHFGGAPANFLDVGGAADKERVAAAFKIIVADPNVRGIFVNIFGGIVHCDAVAQGVVDAITEVGLNVPLVVRLEGTNVEEGKRILSESTLDVTPADDMADGAKKIVERTR